MRTIGEGLSWEGARADVAYTLGVLAAAGRHERLSRAVTQLFERWTKAEATRRAAEDGVAAAHARVAWCDFALDDAVRAFANELLRDVGGKGDAPMFRKYFPEMPSEVVRMGLEAEIERCAAFDVVAGKVKLSKSAAQRLDAVRAAMKSGRDALAARRRAFDAQAQAALDVATWKEDANAVRRSVRNQLEAWALAEGGPGDYADRFFAVSPAKSRGKKAQGAAGGGDKGGTGGEGGGAPNPG